MVVPEDSHYGQEHAEDIGKQCVNKRIMSSWNRRPGGWTGKLDEPGDVKPKVLHQTDADHIGNNGEQCGKGGACSNSQWVNMTSLAEDKLSQQEWWKRIADDIPRPHTPPSNHHRHPIKGINPPCWCEKVKLWPGRISWIQEKRATYQVKWYPSHQQNPEFVTGFIIVDRPDSQAQIWSQIDRSWQPSTYFITAWQVMTTCMYIQLWSQVSWSESL